jgi:hypothetical protein
VYSPDEDGRPLMLGLVMGGRCHTTRTHKIFTYPWFHSSKTSCPTWSKTRSCPNDWTWKVTHTITLFLSLTV